MTSRTECQVCGRTTFLPEGELVCDTCRALPSLKRQEEVTALVRAELLKLLGALKASGDFGDWYREVVDRSVWTADSDRERGLGWAGRKALCVICTEDGLPSACYGHGIKMYFELMERIGLLVEPSNAAIVVVYDD